MVKRIGDGVFRWKTMEGDVLTLDQMETSHIFNSMKMLFNHLAAAWGGQPVWFTKAYGDYVDRAESDPGRLAGVVVLFLQEIQRRGDLPAKYLGPFRAIVEQILPRLEVPQRQLLLPPAPRRRLQ